MKEKETPNIAKDLMRIHMVLTRALDVCDRNCRDILAKKEQTPEGFLNFMKTFSVVLKAHHELEDELVFPYFRDKLKDMPYEKLMADHRQIHGEVATINNLVEGRQKGDQNSKFLELISGALNRIKEIWHPHIGIEESYASVEKLGQIIPPEEHVRLSAEYSRHGMSHANPPYLVLPFLLYNLEPGPREEMSKPMPKMLTMFVMPVLWRRKWISMKPYLLS